MLARVLHPVHLSHLGTTHLFCLPSIPSQPWIPVDPEMWSNQLEQSLRTGDWVTNLCYTLVFVVCCPIWEEAMFRGFLLVSLARNLPTPAAVLASSAVFALCHSKLQTMLPLVLLGSIFSAVYLRTRNLVGGCEAGVELAQFRAPMLS